MVPNSNRFRTFDDARLEFVTYAEAKFGSTIHDTMPSESAAQGLDDDAINSLASGTGEGKGSSRPGDGCSKCGGSHFQRDCTVHSTPREGNGKKCKWGKPWSNSAGKEMSE